MIEVKRRVAFTNDRGSEGWDNRLQRTATAITFAKATCL
jgi:hypothetical protein